MDRMIDVAIVGAGPYGLSVAAHLRTAGVGYRIFGKPMQFWQDSVPHGTLLKSDGDSSDLIDPDRSMSVGRFYAERGEPFSASTPIPVETFISYGEAFQRRFVPDVDVCNVISVERTGKLFRLMTDTGETVVARRVVLAVGIGSFRSKPSALSGLPAELLSHSAEFGSVAHLAGRRVAVIGSGASAIDVAAVSHEAGAHVSIVSGRTSIAFHSAPAPRRLRQKIRRPDTGIGAGWSQWFYVNGPDAFRLLPAATRTRVVTTALGPAPGWFMRDRIEGQVPVISSRVPTGAVLEGNQVRLNLTSRAGAASTLLVDHVVAATGFRVDMQRLEFLGPEILASLKTERGAPTLSSRFETSVKNLFVIGPAAAFSFGPVMRFVHGARFAVPRLARHLIRHPAESRRAADAPVVNDLATVR